MKEITKEEFCKLTGTAEDSYLFNCPEAAISFFRDEKDGIIYYINDFGIMKRFRRFEEYGEIWSSEAKWSIWEVWELMDDEAERRRKAAGRDNGSPEDHHNMGGGRKRSEVLRDRTEMLPGCGNVGL